MDFSDAERRRALQVLELFALKESRDELGIGSVRDALSNEMFPGISTIERRARYFLFVPWLFKASETARGDRLERTKDAELELIRVLVDSDDSAGVIGVLAGRDLRQLPSMIYWSGLARWGIRADRGTREQWARDPHAATVDDEGHQLIADSWWHSNLEPPPEDFPKVATLALRPCEADYLAERIATTCPRTLLAWLIARRRPWPETEFAWQLPFIAELPGDLRRVVDHAQHFSELIAGAHILYNLMLAEATADEDREADYTAQLTAWAPAHPSWDVEDFWSLIASTPARRDPTVRLFVDEHGRDAPQARLREAGDPLTAPAPAGRDLDEDVLRSA